MLMIRYVFELDLLLSYLPISALKSKMEGTPKFVESFTLQKTTSFQSWLFCSSALLCAFEEDNDDDDGGRRVYQLRWLGILVAVVKHFRWKKEQSVLFPIFTYDTVSERIRTKFQTSCCKTCFATVALFWLMGKGYSDNDGRRKSSGIRSIGSSWAINFVSSPFFLKIQPNGN